MIKEQGFFRGLGLDDFEHALKQLEKFPNNDVIKLTQEQSKRIKDFVKWGNSLLDEICNEVEVKLSEEFNLSKDVLDRYVSEIQNYCSPKLFWNRNIQCCSPIRNRLHVLICGYNRPKWFREIVFTLKSGVEIFVHVYSDYDYSNIKEIRQITDEYFGVIDMEVRS